MLPTALPRKWLWHHAAMLLLILVIGLINMIWAEKILVNGGLGWDGNLYGETIKYFQQRALTERLDSYVAQRVFPIAVVYGILQALHLPLENAVIIKTFEVINLLLLLITCGLWISIANHWNLKLQSRWLSFIGLFVNFANFKLLSYYPVLTDCWALMLGMLLFHCFLKRNLAALFVTTLIGAFSWPVLIYNGFLLLIFPRQALETASSTAHPDGSSDDTIREPNAQKSQRWLSRLVALSLVIITAILVAYACSFNTGTENSLFVRFVAATRHDELIVSDFVAVLVFGGAEAFLRYQSADRAPKFAFVALVSCGGGRDGFGVGEVAFAPFFQSLQFVRCVADVFQNRRVGAVQQNSAVFGGPRDLFWANRLAVCVLLAAHGAHRARTGRGPGVVADDEFDVEPRYRIASCDARLSHFRRLAGQKSGKPRVEPRIFRVFHRVVAAAGEILAEN